MCRPRAHYFLYFEQMDDVIVSSCIYSIIIIHLYTVGAYSATLYQKCLYMSSIVPKRNYSNSSYFIVFIYYLNMGANSSCSGNSTEKSKCCGGCNVRIGAVDQLPERRVLSKSRRWNHVSRSSASSTTRPLIGGHIDPPFEDEKVNRMDRLSKRMATDVTDLVDSVLFHKFGANTKHTVFGFVRKDIEPLIGCMASSYSSIREYDDSIPKNVLYLILLYYYSMENEFGGESLDLWHQRAALSEFMDKQASYTLTRMWDKFDRQRKGLVPTERCLSKFLYTFFVLYLKSKQRKSVPPKYAKVKKCTKYMSILIIQTLPNDQKQFLDKNYFVDKIIFHLALICSIGDHHP